MCINYPLNSIIYIKNKGLQNMGCVARLTHVCAILKLTVIFPILLSKINLG